MLLAELLKDDVKDSLYCKTKDYFVGDENIIKYKTFILVENEDGSCTIRKSLNSRTAGSENYLSVQEAKKAIDEGEKKMTGDSHSQFCRVGDVGGRQIIFKYKLDGEVKTIKMPVREILRYSNKNASEAATRYLSENFPGAKLIEVGTSDSCKVGDVAFGGKGYKCTKCHATADSVHKIVHVKDDSESKLYEIENEVSNKI